MSDVLIKNMKMPESCGTCPCTDEEGDTCLAIVADVVFCEFHQRPKDCPLVEIQPHGRLIDADAFERFECNRCDGACDVVGCDCTNCDSDFRCDIMSDLHNAPTVIEAEEANGYD